MTNEEKAQALLGSPAGSAFVLDVSANLVDHPLEHFADPKVSFWLASTAIDFCDAHRDAGFQDIALREASGYDELALRIVGNPAFAWWYEPLDPENQTWSSPQMPNSADRGPLKLFDPGSWRKPGPLRADEDWPIPNTFSQITSTLRGDSTSEWTAFVLYACDHICAFPLAAWQVRFGQSVRVREINHPADWHDLCLEFPHRAPDGGLIPNWPEVADAWDGVHVTLGGTLSCDQARYERDGEWSMMKFWHAEQTCWMDHLEIAGKRMPDILESHNPQKFKRFPYGPELRARASFVLR